MSQNLSADVQHRRKRWVRRHAQLAMTRHDAGVHFRQKSEEGGSRARAVQGGLILTTTVHRGANTLARTCPAQMPVLARIQPFMIPNFPIYTKPATSVVECTPIVITHPAPIPQSSGPPAAAAFNRAFICAVP